MSGVCPSPDVHHVLLSDMLVELDLLDETLLPALLHSGSISVTLPSAAPSPHSLHWNQHLVPSGCDVRPAPPTDVRWELTSPASPRRLVQTCVCMRVCRSFSLAVE